jgi:hypothetical protein
VEVDINAFGCGEFESVHLLGGGRMGCADSDILGLVDDVTTTARCAKNFLEFGSESDVEHGVDLVDDKVPSEAEVNSLEVEELEEAPGGRHQDVDRGRGQEFLEFCEARAAGPGICADDAEFNDMRDGFCDAEDLVRELAGGDDDDGARAAGDAERGVSVMAQQLCGLHGLNDGEEVGEGLARTGGGAEDDVGAAQDGRDAADLYAGRARDACLGEGSA